MNSENKPEKRILTVLLAEDDPANLKLMVTLFKKRSWQTVSAENGMEAVDEWEKGGIDLIIMDINMPFMNGYEASAMIRKREKETGGYTPIIAITAFTYDKDIDKAKKCGIDAHLPKPIDSIELFTTIDKVLFQIKKKPEGQ